MFFNYYLRFPCFKGSKLLKEYNMKNFLKIILGIKIAFFCIISTAETIIDIDYRAVVISTSNAMIPDSNSRVTYVLNGVEYRPDGYIYNNDERSGQWGFMYNNTQLINIDAYYNRMAEKNNEDYKININSGGIEGGTPGSSDNGSGLVNLGDPKVRAKLGTGFIASPSDGKSYYIGDNLYESDGKVYHSGMWTGEYWGVPGSFKGAINGAKSNGGFFDGLSDEFKEGATGSYKFIRKFKSYVEYDSKRKNYAKSQKQNYKNRINNITKQDSENAKNIREISDEIKREKNKHIDSIAEGSVNSEIEYKEPRWLKGFNETKAPIDLNSDKVKFNITDKSYKRIIENFEHAVKYKDYNKISNIIEMSINSSQPLSDEIKAYLSPSLILIPEKIDSTLPESPLSEFVTNWKQDTHLGQIATRTANKIQKKWAQQKGYKYSPTEDLLNFLTTISVFRKAVNTIDLDERLAKNLFKLTQNLLDFEIGVAIGIGEQAVNILQGTPFLAKEAKDFIYKSVLDPNHAVNTYHKIIKNIPEIKKAFLNELNQKLETLNDGSAYQRGKLTGELFLDIALNFASGGGSVAGRAGIKVTNYMRKSLKRLSANKKWIIINGEALKGVEKAVNTVRRIGIKPKDDFSDFSKATEQLTNNSVDKALKKRSSGLSSPERRSHILEGDKSGGGHKWPAKTGKSSFPRDWNSDKIMETISDIVTDPKIKWRQLTGKPGATHTKGGLPVRYEAVGIKDGINIKVIVEPGGKGIITAFPLG